MALSFAQDVLPLFRPADRQCMAGFGVLLADYVYMSNPAGDATYSDHANARHVLARVDGTELPRMPPGAAAAWDQAKIDLLRSWIDEGCPT